MAKYKRKYQSGGEYQNPYSKMSNEELSEKFNILDKTLYGNPKSKNYNILKKEADSIQLELIQRDNARIAGLPKSKTIPNNMITDYNQFRNGGQLYANGGDIQYGPDGNPIIPQSTDEPGSYGENAGANAGQYAAIGTAALSGTANSYNTFQDPNSTIKGKSESMDATTVGTASAINPLVGGIIGAGQMIGKPIRNKAETMDEQGNLTNQRGAQIGAIAGGLFDPIKAITTRASYKGGFSDITGKGYTDAIQKEARDAYKLAHPDAPAVDNKDYQQDTAWQKLNNQTQMAMGGNLTQYEGYKHEMGGIPIGMNAEVEAGETRGMPNSSTQDYIFSDKLKIPGKKYTFAKMSKMIENKFSKRDNDKLSSEQKEREMHALMQSHEAVRNNIMTNAYKKAFGGDLGVPVVAPIGGQKLSTEAEKTFPFYQEQDGKYYTGQMRMTPTAFSTADRSGRQKLPYNAEISLDEYNKYKGTTNMFQPYRTKEYIENTKVPTFAMGGGLDRSEDYGSKSRPYPSVESNDFAGGDRSYPIPTEADAVDALRLAGLHNRADVRAKVYAKYPSLKKHANGGGLFGQQNAPYMTAEERDRLQFENDVREAEAQGQSFNPIGMDSSTKYPDQMQLKSVDSVIPESSNRRQGFGRNFDPNSMYNAGNFLGAAYDIGRGLKGGDPVNYERVTPETVNPELVNYQSSRDLQRRDIKEGFGATQDALRNVNNPAAYLSLLTQTAGQRDKTISDSIAKSYENELNTNATIKGRANEFNAQAKNQGKYFNAQTQQAEANARQQEKDIASNTLSTGLYNAGSALAQTGVDRKGYATQAEAKKLIGTGDYSYEYDSKGKIKGIKFNKTGDVTPIK